MTVAVAFVVCLAVAVWIHELGVHRRHRDASSSLRRRRTDRLSDHERFERQQRARGEWER